MKPLLLALLLVLTSAAHAAPWLVNDRPCMRTIANVSAGQILASENNCGSRIQFTEPAPATQGKKYNPPGTPKLPHVPKLPSLPKVPRVPQVPRLPKVPR